jgi:RNA recognition motif-containing protein
MESNTRIASLILTVALLIPSVESFGLVSLGRCNGTPAAATTCTSLSATSPNKPRSYKTSDGSSILDFHNERVKTAGRRGQKKFVDPCKLFIGNLPYDATEDDIRILFANYYRTSPMQVNDRIESIKIIRDWKTGQSKGYGFLMFYNALDATTCMKFMKGDGFTIRGRPVRFDQGKKKSVDEDMRETKKAKRKLKQQMMEETLDDEGKVIHSALESVEIDIPEEEDRMSEDDMITFMEKGGLRGVMPLTEELAGYLGQEGLYEEEDEAMDYFDENSYDFDDLDEDDDGESLEDFVYDGVFEEMYNPDEFEDLSEEEEKTRATMNREQRRAADKRRKKKKLPFKGFGKQD